jgi:peptide/nickel transport system permease protein
MHAAQHTRRLRLPAWIGLLFSKWLAAIGCIMLAIITLLCIFAPLLTSYAPGTMADTPSMAPSAGHWFGTNQQGEDVLSQVLYGGRFSLFIGVTAGLATTVLSVIVGMTAGYVGGWLDEILGVITNIFLVIPQLPLLIVLGAYLQAPGPVSLILVISLTGWAWGARILRSQTLSLRNRDFVQAAIISGESTWRIVFREIMPNMISLIASTLIFAFIGSIMAESGLEFLGIGDVNTTSWGTTLYWAQTNQTLLTGAWWHFTFPGLALALTATACTFVNYGIDTISNPRLRKVRMPKIRNISGARASTISRGRS